IPGRVPEGQGRPLPWLADLCAGHFDRPDRDWPPDLAHPRIHPRGGPRRVAPPGRIDSPEGHLNRAFRDGLTAIDDTCIFNPSWFRQVLGGAGESPRTKKGGANTSVRLRILRGRSGTSQRKSPPTRRAFSFSVLIC